MTWYLWYSFSNIKGNRKKQLLGFLMKSAYLCFIRGNYVQKLKLLRYLEISTAALGM